MHNKLYVLCRALEGVRALAVRNLTGICGRGDWGAQVVMGELVQPGALMPPRNARGRGGGRSTY